MGLIYQGFAGAVFMSSVSLCLQGDFENRDFTRFSHVEILGSRNSLDLILPKDVLDLTSSSGRHQVCLSKKEWLTSTLGPAEEL